MKVIIFANNKCNVYNIGFDKAISIWQLAKYFSKKSNIKFIYPKQDMNKFDFYIPNT